MITASSLPRLEACPASGALPQVREPSSADATRGTAIHAFVERAIMHGRESALAAVGDELRPLCAAIDIEGLYGAAGGTVSCEVPLAYDVATDTARTMPRGEHRAYTGLRPTEIPGTVDTVETWGDPVERVRVSDLKSGFVYVASDTLQLAFYGLAVARIYGVDEVTVRIVQLDERGHARTDERTYDAFDLLAIAGRIADTFAAVERARVVVGCGTTPSVSMGDHCTYCPCVAACPAHVGLARSVMGDLTSGDIEARLAAATPEEVGALYAKLLAVGPVWERVEKGLKATIDRLGEVPLPDGRKVVARQTPVRSIDGKIALPILRDALGAAADSLVSSRVTMADIERAAGERADELLARIDAAGGIHQKTIKRHATVGKARA